MAHTDFTADAETLARQILKAGNTTEQKYQTRISQLSQKLGEPFITALAKEMDNADHLGFDERNMAIITKVLLIALLG